MAETLAGFLAANPVAMQVRVTAVQGSAPREAGAWMVVAPGATLGTIGGGQLEYMAIDKARALLRAGTVAGAMDVPLGPGIGQCCGGRVRLSLRALDGPARAAALAAAAAAEAALPQVLVLGAGHVGRALADLFQHLPVRCLLVDSRAEELAQCPAAVETRLTALPEAAIRAAPPGSAFVIVTHDHALDFLAAAEALDRGDAAYVGMIGSATKRAAFRAWCRRHRGGLPAGALTCPIGAGGSRDKRPAVIAALTVAEVLTALSASHPMPARQIAGAS